MKTQRLSKDMVIVILTHKEMERAMQTFIKAEGFEVKAVKESLHHKGFIIRMEREPKGKRKP